VFYANAGIKIGRDPALVAAQGRTLKTPGSTSENVEEGPKDSTQSVLPRTGVFRRPAGRKEKMNDKSGAPRTELINEQHYYCLADPARKPAANAARCILKLVRASGVEKAGRSSSSNKSTAAISASQASVTVPGACAFIALASNPKSSVARL
jgi:hypothetical protein